MFVLQIKELFAQKGILRPYRQLLKMGIPRNRARMMLNGTSKNITYSDLYKFCTYLNCTPKELLLVELPPDSTSLDGTALKDWVKKEDINLINEILQMPPEELRKMKDFYRAMKAE